MQTTFRLIFRTMQGNAYRSRSRRMAATTVSAILMLAFALFPVLAQASDSAGAQYQDRLPTATGPNKHNPDKTDKNKNGSGNQGSGNGGNTSQGGGAGGGGGGGSSPPSGPNSAPSGSSGSGNAGVSGGSSGGTGASPTQGSGADSLKLGSNADYQSGSGDDGGSSPLAGILVGLGLGAIVSVIFVVLRARRQRDDSDAVHSPNAG